MLYSVIQTRDVATQELYFRIQEGEKSFSDLARRYSQGPEAPAGGLVSLVELSVCHPSLAKIFYTSQLDQFGPLCA